MKVPKPPKPAKFVATRPIRASSLRKKAMRAAGIPVIRKGKALTGHGGDRRR